MKELLSLVFFTLHMALEVLSWMVLIYVILSWFPLKLHTIRKFLYDILGPMLRIAQKYVPPIGGVIDLSPIFVYFMIDFCRIILAEIAKVMV